MTFLILQDGNNKVGLDPESMVGEMFHETQKALSKPRKSWAAELYLKQDPLKAFVYEQFWDAMYCAIQTDKWLMVKGGMVA